jgi:hypothetical protein
MSFTGLFDHRVQSHRTPQPPTRGPLGSVIETWPAVQGAPLANNAKWTPDDHDIEPMGSGDQPTLTGTLSVLPDFDIARRDLVNVLSGPDAPMVLLVVSITTPRGHHIKAKCDIYTQPVTLLAFAP